MKKSSFVGGFQRIKAKPSKVKGVILASDRKTVLAEASGVFFKQHISTIIGEHHLPGWEYVADQQPVSEIEINYEFIRD